jgi:hypothetical protein
MAGQPERVINMMITLVTVFGICSGLWGLLLAAQLVNLEKFFIQYLHHREPGITRLFEFLAPPLRLHCAAAPAAVRPPTPSFSRLRLA